MKCILVLLLGATVTFAQTIDFTTGQAARLVIGQTTFTSQDPNSSDTILGGVSGLAFAADTLFVTDSNRVGAGPSNHRVLLYKGASSMFPGPTAQFTDSSKCPICVGKASVVLGQPNFTTTTENIAATSSALRLPTAVASDGVHVVVADTNHNRVLIWNRIPTLNNQPADVVVGQADFSSATVTSNTPTAKSMRGPQGVWIQNGKLYVADTQNNRVLIYNKIPTANGAAADVVLGAPDFTTFVQPDLTQQTTNVSASNMQNPVSVTSDGVKLFVTDLGDNRVLIWNTIPTSNGAAADVALGQPDLTSSIANYGYKTDPADTTQKQTPVLCQVSNGTDTNSNPTYPAICQATLNFPRFALSTGTRLFIADGGNDRVLVFNKIPTQSGTQADYIIGQIKGSVNQASDAADSLRTPMAMAWDGTNLYVSDAYNRRVTVYSVGATSLPYQAVRNAASQNITAFGAISVSLLSGDSIHSGDVLTVTISGTNYTYTVKAADTVVTITQAIVDAINASNSGSGDPNVLVYIDPTTNAIILRAKASGTDGNNVTYSAAVTGSSATLTATAAGANLSGGADSAQIAPGTIVSLNGTNLTGASASADLTQPALPRQLAGTQVYFNGIPAPLFFVSPTQINAQVPWELSDTTSINAYVRSVMPDGSIMTTTPVAVTITPANPGIFTQPNSDPAATSSPAVAVHASSKAIGIISVDGTVTANDVTTVTIEDRSYSYTVVTGDTLDTVRDNLVALINQDPKVTASSSGVFDRILIQARVEGPEGNSITIGASANSSATVIMTAFSTSLCCANVAGSPITVDNPAVPGELILVYATGLGLPNFDNGVGQILQTGIPYPTGAPTTSPQVSVSSIAGSKTADVITASLVPGMVGTFQVLLHLNGDIPTDPNTKLTIAQDIFVSNVVSIPVVNPNPGQ